LEGERRKEGGRGRKQREDIMVFFVSHRNGQRRGGDFCNGHIVVGPYFDEKGGGKGGEEKGEKGEKVDHRRPSSALSTPEKERKKKKGVWFAIGQDHAGHSAS